MTLIENRTPAGFAADAAGPTPIRLRRRRNRGATALALALVGTGVTVGVVTVRDAGGRAQVLVLARDVPAGFRVTDADLAVAGESSDPSLALVPASSRSTVVGRFAAVPLTAGSTLTLRSLTVQPLPGPGSQVVAVLVKAGQAPATGLHPGDPVWIISTPGDTGDTSSAAALGHPVGATIKDVVATTGADGSSVMDLVVADADASTVAQASSTGHVAILARPAAG
jgi:hypothetical protein